MTIEDPVVVPDLAHEFVLPQRNDQWGMWNTQHVWDGCINHWDPISDRVHYLSLSLMVISYLRR